MPPRRLFGAFLAAAFVVSLGVAFISAYLSPKCVRELRVWASQVRADVVTNIIQPGRFTAVERGLVFHIRERQPNGLLLGIFVDDQRDPNEESTFLADRGEIIEDEKGTYLVMDDGSVQRHRPDQRDPTIVHFDRYAFDLSRLSGGAQAGQYLVRELYLWQLAAPAPDDPVMRRDPAQFRAEFHDRVAAPLYPLAFAIIAFAYLGAPSTTRQSRVVAITSAVAAVAAMRVLGFISIIFGITAPAALVLQYVGFLTLGVLGLIAISRGVVIQPPTAIVNWLANALERLMRRYAAS
jgi:lipopolysaccharide export system permease protein